MAKKKSDEKENKKGTGSTGQRRRTSVKKAETGKISKGSAKKSKTRPVKNAKSETSGQGTIDERRKYELIGLAFSAVAIFCFCGLLGLNVGFVGVYFAKVLSYFFGIGAYAFSLLMLLIGVQYIIKHEGMSFTKRFWGILILFVCVLSIWHHFNTPVGEEILPKSLQAGGGLLGGGLLFILRRIVGVDGAIIVLGTGTLGSVLLATTWSLASGMLKTKETAEAGINVAKNTVETAYEKTVAVEESVKQRVRSHLEERRQKKESFYNQENDTSFEAVSADTAGNVIEKEPVIQDEKPNEEELFQGIYTHSKDWPSSTYFDTIDNGQNEDIADNGVETAEVDEYPEEFENPETEPEEENPYPEGTIDDALAQALGRAAVDAESHFDREDAAEEEQQFTIEFADSHADTAEIAGEDIPEEAFEAAEMKELEKDSRLETMNEDDSKGNISAYIPSATAVSPYAPAPPPPQAVQAEKPKPKPYVIPDPKLILSKRVHKKNEQLEMEIAEKAKTLATTLDNFKVKARIVNACHGPAVTRYELELAPGVRVSKLTNLADDLALSLAAFSVRIEQIPGKAAIGIEVPNKELESVQLREVLESEAFAAASSKLTVGLGKDISGQSIFADLAKMPHLLVAGATGSGKSVCINTLITSILFKARPDEVKFILIDPKMVELSVYNGIPHLMVPVVTDSKKAASVLNWAVQEMEKRYAKFAEKGARNMETYNASHPEDKMPSIVIIIDELADLMMVAPHDVEDAICRLAQKARAAGIHLVLATQRPSVNVITGVIKANIPSRISFAVSSLVDSRTILDRSGAEKLLGKGDMLFYPIGAAKPKRVQGAFVSDREVEELIDFIQAQEQEVETNEEIINFTEQAAQEAEEEKKDNRPRYDELLPEAVQSVLSTGQASASGVQRRFRVGYTRAARLIDTMEELHIVGASQGSKPRDILMTSSEAMAAVEKAMSEN